MRRLSSRPAPSGLRRPPGGQLHYHGILTALTTVRVISAAATGSWPSSMPAASSSICDGWDSRSSAPEIDAALFFHPGKLLHLSRLLAPRLPMSLTFLASAAFLRLFDDCVPFLGRPYRIAGPRVKDEEPGHLAFDDLPLLVEDRVLRKARQLRHLGFVGDRLYDDAPHARCR